MNIIGHRGCADRFPENSLAAIRGCAEHVDMIEIDVQQCEGGEIVVFHDDDLDRLTAASGPVSETSVQQITSLRIGDSTETVPTFEAVLDALPNETGLNVELKHGGMAAEIAPQIRQLDHDVIVSSFEPDAIAAFADEPTPTGYIYAKPFSKPIQTATELGCEYIHPLHELVDEQLIEEATDHGLSVNAWTPSDRESIVELRELGVDGVIVDDWEIVPDA